MRNISASGEAILANTKDYNSINAWWMNNAGKDNDFKLNFVTTQDGGKVLDDESKQKWLAKYEEQAKSLIPNYTVVTEDNAKELGMEVGTEFIDTQAAETSLSKVTKPTPPKEDTSSLFNYNAFKADPLSYLQSENMRGFKYSDTNPAVLTFDVLDKEGKVTSVDEFNVNKPSDIKALFLTMDNTKAGRKRAEEIYQIAIADQNKKIQKAKKENEKAVKSFNTKVKSLIDLRKKLDPTNSAFGIEISQIPKNLLDMYNIVGNLSIEDLEKLTLEDYSKMSKEKFDKNKEKTKTV
jgi:hypothetical protein